MSKHLAEACSGTSQEAGITARSGEARWSMWALGCSIEQGVFSNERLIHFRDADGEHQSALVDHCFVDETARTVQVPGVTEGQTVIVAIPGDGHRVRVPLTTVVPAT
jgi:hypothetical protein